MDNEIRALRTSVALAAGDHVTCLRVEGEGAYEALDHVVACDLFLQDGQMRPSLLLDEEARPFADIHVARDDESFFLLAEGPSPEELVAFLDKRFPSGVEATVERCDGTLLSLHGPYAWELCTTVFGPDVGSLPYLAFYRTDDAVFFRSGKTGEYGYDLLIPTGEVETVREALLREGAAFDLSLTSLAALDQCGLENGFFNIRREGRAGLSPLELGLQWRVSYRKEYVGSAALRARREAGAKARVVWAVAGAPVAEGDEIFLDDQRIGHVLVSGFSVIRGEWVALLLLDRPYAYAGVTRYETHSAGERRPIRTLSAPLLNNRSLYVSPQRHSYRARDESKMPPFVLPL
ncbi:glycine cleavage T C-terminal barrel domain-containing protein [Polyangium mundeleinium]|uniref:Glycine cleavage T C-terminal barrel domain-containing protein n=1 Tax=Polyangium mundeleinium TaxID=2995306 RepID=A0ABT5F8K6_9BACT|nr:glycine cleavage T C-terminal barrel domain-containing protein [Polyangium mundeleinium]MDC0749441.1 glycine cleavage T C-terminal barrel domain-containing protein [Polyangium mundeleinium]